VFPRATAGQGAVDRNEFAERCLLEQFDVHNPTLLVVVETFTDVIDPVESDR
jgi:hypothetical protein